MAEKQVVRQDVIQITWDVQDSPFKKLTSEANKFQSSVGKAVGKSESNFNKFANSMTKGWNKAVSGAEKLKSKLTPLDTKINQIGKSALNAGKKIASGLGSTAVKSVKVLGKAVVGLGTAFAGLVGVSTKNYAEYEQLVGGVETLFKNSKSKVMGYANDAYKNAGLSANDYMSTVTSFSASLISSVKGDTNKAAELANRAIVDMSDNANKMGTDMGSIQNAYQGFAKQNYTMLDNLKLGYGGTKEEMERLVKEASTMKDVQKELGVTVDGSSLSFANIVNAISVVQKKMGITGTTSKEASTTIQGSFLSMKAAASNFMTGMADPTQDFDQLFNNLIDSVEIFAKNLIPRIKKIAPRLGLAIVAIGKEIAPYIPPLLKSIGTKIVEYAPIVGAKFKELLLTAKNYLIENKGVIWDGLKTAVAYGVNLISQLFTGEDIDLETIKTKIQEITDKAISFANSIKENWPTIKKTLIGVGIAIGVVKGAIFACNAVIAINNGLMKAKQAIDIAMAAKAKIAAAAQWAMNTSIMGCPVFWLIAAIAALIAIIVLLVKNWDKVKEVAAKCWDGIKKTWGKVSSWFKSSVVDPVKKWFTGLWDNVTDKASEVKGKIVDAFKEAVADVKSAWSGIKDFFSDIWKQTVKNVATPVNKLIDGANWVLEKVGSDKKFGHWEPYARGTNGHPGGNAIVNDGRGAELVQFPNGKTFIPNGRNVGIPNAPKGMKVLDAERTARLMGKSSPTFNYAGGIGDWAIWDFFDNAKGLVKKVIDKFISWNGVGGYALDVGKALISKATGSMADWIKGLFKEFGGKGLGDYVASKGVEQWRSTVVQALSMEGLNTAANIKRTLYQMQTESGGNPRAINNWDSNAKKGTPSKGLMQVIDPTFKAYARKGYNSNIYDPLSNILASVRYAVSRYGSLEKAYRGVGYEGGIGFPRLRLPVYSPASSVPVSGAGSTHNNNYNPSFTLNMSGTVDRTTERTIKRWVREAMEETFDSIERTSPRLTEV